MPEKCQFLSVTILFPVLANLPESGDCIQKLCGALLVSCWNRFLFVISVPVSHHNAPYETISCHIDVLFRICPSLSALFSMGLLASLPAAVPPAHSGPMSYLVKVVAHAARCDKNLQPAFGTPTPSPSQRPQCKAPPPPPPAVGNKSLEAAAERDLAPLLAHHPVAAHP